MQEILKIKIRAFFESILINIMFFSRLPIYKFFPEIAERRFFKLNDDCPALPIASCIISLPVILILYLGMQLSLDHAIIILLAMGLSMLLTGCLHEDGLADCADGFGGGHTKDQKLSIMKDSLLGSYGVLALIFTFFARYLGLLSLLANSSNIDFIAFFLCIFMSSRISAMLLAIMLKPAKANGLGQGAGELSIQNAAKMGVLASIIIFIMVIFTNSILPLFIILSCLLGMIIAGIFAYKHIGGYTGDVFGFAQITSEITALLLLAILL